MPSLLRSAALLLVSILVLLAPIDAAAKEAAVGSLPAKEKRYALIVGVDAYDDSQLQELGAAATDAKAMADALIAVGGFPADQVIVMSTGLTRDRLPTKNNILSKFVGLLRQVPHDGLLLLAYAGHGIERKGKPYLLPADAQSSDDTSFLDQTAISVSWIQEQIRDRRIGQVLLFLDTCRNDPSPASHGGRADRLTDSYLQAFSFSTRNHDVTAYATFYATAVGELAYENSEKHQSYFTRAVVDGLRGEAANDKGEVTLNGLVAYVQQVVPKRVALELGGDRQQRPFAVIDGYRADDLVLSVIQKPTLPEVIQTPAVTGTDAQAAELRFWDAVVKLDTQAAYNEYLQRYPHGIYAVLARMSGTRTSKSPSLREVAESAYAVRNFGQARGTLVTAAAAGDADAQARLGALSFLCLGTSCDWHESTRLLESAALRGSHEAEGWYALQWALCTGDPTRGLSYARASAARGELPGLLALARAYEDGNGVEPDVEEADRLYVRALPALRAGAEAGDPWLMYVLGNLYYLGQGLLPEDQAAAVKLYREAADAGYARSKLRLGYLYQYGQGGLPKDPAKAMELYRSAASQAHPYASFELGLAYETGWVVSQDLEKAAELYGTAADQLDPAGQSALAEMYEHGRGGLPKDEGKAVALYRAAAEQNDLYAYIRLGTIYETGNSQVPRDFRMAAKLYEKAASRGRSDAEVNLGLMYQNDHDGWPKDLKKAAELFRLAADAGDTAGQNALAHLYEKGSGIPQDWAQALRWYTKAADAGDANAQFNLGVAYRKGSLGLHRNDAKARELFEKASVQKQREALTNLGAFYAEGRAGLPRDLAKAAELYQEAVDLGEPYAMANLAALYEGGLGGLNKDPAKALELYRQAVKAGHESSADDVARLSAP